MRASKNPETDGRFVLAPYFNWNDGMLKFDTNDADNPNDNYGSASGFSPKSPLTWTGIKQVPVLFSPT